MQRVVSKTANLKTFSVDIDQLDALASKLQGMYRGPHGVRTSITAESRNESFSFDSFDELRAARDLPSRFTNFSLTLSGYVDTEHARVNIVASQVGATASAYGPTPGWSAGAIEEAVQFARNHRTWIPFSKYSRSGWSIVPIIAVLPFGTTEQGIGVLARSPYLIVAWTLTTLALVTLFFAYSRIPAAILRTSLEERWWRRHSIELTIGIAFLGLICSVLSLAMPFFARAH